MHSMTMVSAAAYGRLSVTTGRAHVGSSSSVG
jgi:hypothetical protein